MSHSRHVSPLRAVLTYTEVDSEEREPNTIFSPFDSAKHPAFQSGRVAVITGAASGIGRAAALELARHGLKVVLADIDAENLDTLGREIAAEAGEQNVLAIPTDVSSLEQVQRLKDKAYETFGEVAVLINNAGISPLGTALTGLDNWKKVIDVNLWGVIYMQQTFGPIMVHQENPSVIINTGSKRGITNPPGDAAYNASKAALKSLTEGLAWELREQHSKVTAHLFMPGHTYTGMTQGDTSEKPAGAWTAEQTVQYLLERVRLGDFYIIAPDNETPSHLDKLRMQWAMEDVTEGRPALSRWHSDFKREYEEFVREGMSDQRRRSPTTKR